MGIPISRLRKYRGKLVQLKLHSGRRVIKRTGTLINVGPTAISLEIPLTGAIYRIIIDDLISIREVPAWSY